MQAIDVMTGLLKDGLLERNKNKMRLIDPENQRTLSIIEQRLADSSLYCVSIDGIIAHIYSDDSCIGARDGEYCATSCDNLAFQCELKADWYKVG